MDFNFAKRNKSLKDERNATSILQKADAYAIPLV